jgi:hypothetical protein
MRRGHKTLVKFDGCYWRGIPNDNKWLFDQTITKEDWSNGHLESITIGEAEKNSQNLRLNGEKGADSHDSDAFAFGLKNLPT